MTLFYCLLDLSCGESYVISLYFVSYTIGVSVCPVCCLFVNCLGKQFAMCLGVVAILFLNVMEYLVCVVVLCWIERVWSSKECTCCAFDPSVHLSVPSISFVCVFVCRKLSPHLRV